MTPLRTKMEADLRLRKLAAGTAALYIQCVARFAAFFACSPARLGESHVREYLDSLVLLGRASATINVYHAALRFLYDRTLGRPEVFATIPRARAKRQQQGIALSNDAVRVLLKALSAQLFDYTFFVTMLNTGMRISEASLLQVGDIDASAGLIHIRHGKGDKRRLATLSSKHYRLLRRYWELERPRKPWMFPAQRLSSPGQVDRTNRWADHPVHPDTMSERLRGLTRECGIRATSHDLRRTYATWLIEDGVNLRVVQVLLGHASPETTARYTMVQPGLIARTPTPLDLL